MKLRSLIALAALAALPMAAQRNRITHPIDTQRTIALPEQVHPRALPQFDRGAVDPAFAMNNLSMVLGPSAAQQQDLESFLASVQDPSSPDYQKWLTPEQFADRFGPSQSDYNQVVSYLQSQGFTIHTLAPSRNWIAFGGNAGTVQQAFHTEIHHFQVDGLLHFANTTAPSIPEALAGLVAYIRGLHDFLLHPPRPAFTSGGSSHYLAPDDVSTIYNLAPLYKNGYDGTGQKMVIAGQTAINVSDIQNFRTLFGLSSNTPQVLLVPGRPNPGTVSGDVIEADLDLEWSGAVARGASITYVYSGNVLDAVQYAVSQNLAPVISLSYGGCETQGGGSSLRLIAQQANAQGITWIASSGDSGAAGCESATATVATHGPAVDLPASIPEVTAVGGTRFNEGSGAYWASSNSVTFASALSYIPEMAWNDTSSSGFASSGGGASVVFSKPTWQAGTGVPADGARDVPDVAMAASANHDGAILCNGGSCANGISGVNTVVGGTSLSAPLFAGIATMVNHYRVATGAQAQAGLGNMNPSLYSLAQTSTDAFHDVTTGNNVVPCQTGTTGCSTGSFGYQAGAGYDLVTGLGSVNAYNLAVEWHAPITGPAALVSVSANPSTVTGGAAATLTVNLSAAAPAGGAVVTLGSNAAAFPVPASLTIAAGQSSGSIQVTTAKVTASTPATVTATYLSVSKTAVVTVAPVATPALSSVTVNPASLIGGGTATVTITLSSAALTGGASVTLSSNSTAFPVPASATVPAGQSSVSLQVVTKAVTASTTATVTATFQSVTKTAIVTLTSPAALPTITSVTVSPASVTSGGTVTLTVVLSTAAPTGGTAITLSSSNQSAVPLSGQVTMPAGYSTGYLQLRAGTVTASTAVTLSASANSTTQSATLTVTPRATRQTSSTARSK